MKRDYSRRLPADRLLHAFVTPFGFPPDTDTVPACGALISREYGRFGPFADRCAICDQLVTIARSSLIADAAEAVETIDADELERHARRN